MNRLVKKYCLEVLTPIVFLHGYIVIVPLQCLTIPVLPVLYQKHIDLFGKDVPIEDIVSRLAGPPHDSGQFYYV